MTTLRSDIESIAQMIWESLFEMPITSGGDGELGTDPQLTGVVHLDGAFQGAVMIECPVALGSKLTAAMIHGQGAPGSEDMVDALGELTNMFAGNLKALLAKPSAISLPTVVFGPQYEIGVVGATVVVRVPFRCEEQPLVVTVLQRSVGPSPTS